MSRSQYWCFTIANPQNDNFINIPCEYMIFQLELTQLLHYQGYITFLDCKRMQTVKNIFTLYDNNHVHLESRKGTHKEAKDYCMKKETQIDGPYEIGDDSNIPQNEEKKGKRSDLLYIQDMINNGSSYREIEQKYFGQCVRYSKFIKEKVNERDSIIFNDDEKIDNNKKELRIWQLQALKIIENMKPKEVIWIYGVKGHEGKSHLADHIILNQSGYLATNKKSENITYLYDKEKVIVFNYTRENDKKISYQLIEEFLDGRIVSTKYEPQKKYVRNPKVIVFANWPPESGKITEEKLKIYEIVEFEDNKEGRLAKRDIVLHSKESTKTYYN
nr:MAG: replication associated protein [Cressdnaviricota sp.]